MSYISATAEIMYAPLLLRLVAIADLTRLSLLLRLALHSLRPCFQPYPKRGVHCLFAGKCLEYLRLDQYDITAFFEFRRIRVPDSIREVVLGPHLIRVDTTSLFHTVSPPCVWRAAH